MTRVVVVGVGKTGVLFMAVLSVLSMIISFSATNFLASSTAGPSVGTCLTLTVASSKPS